MNNKISKKLAVILMGPPGAGKGTQAALLSGKLGLYRLEPSKIIEKNVMKAKKGDYVIVAGKKYLLSKEKKYWKTGKLCSPLLISFWIKKKIKGLAKAGENLLMEGTPRTLQEAKEVIPFVKKLYGKSNVKVILIKLKAETSIWRNSHRRICELIRHPILYNKETKSLKHCALDGSKLLKRKGLDDPKTIRVRLEEYKKRTLPLVDYFSKKGLKVKRVDGSLSPADVFHAILKALK